GTTAISVTNLNTAWGSGFDVIGMVRPYSALETDSNVVSDWVRAKWDSGVPILIGGYHSSDTSFHPAIRMGMLTALGTESTASSSATDLMAHVGSHPITSSAADPLTLYASKNTAVVAK